MSYKFKKEWRNWIEYRHLDGVMEHDFHRSQSGQNQTDWQPYAERMQAIYDETIVVLAAAQRQGKRFVLFTHGSSTSRPGTTTSRSQVRKAMQSAIATPLLIRRECIQQETVFLAAIKPIGSSAPSTSDSTA